MEDLEEKLLTPDHDNTVVATRCTGAHLNASIWSKNLSPLLKTISIASISSEASTYDWGRVWLALSPHHFS